MYVYCFCHPSLPERYIGKTCQNLQEYFRYNMNQALRGEAKKPKLYEAIRQNPDGWEIFALLECSSDEDAYHKERLMIALYGTAETGLNCNRGYGGRHKIVFRPEVPKKDTRFKHGHTMPDEVRAKISAKLQGVAKNRTAPAWNKGIPMRADLKAVLMANRSTKCGNRKGYTPSQETRTKLSIAAAADWQKRKGNLDVCIHSN